MDVCHDRQRKQIEERTNDHGRRKTDFGEERGAELLLDDHVSMANRVKVLNVWMILVAILFLPGR